MCRSTLLSIFVSLIFAVNSVPQSKWFESTEDDGTAWVSPIEKCQKGDDSVLDECLRRIVKAYTPLVGAGIDELDLPALDPIEIKKFAYDQSFGPINVSVHNRNIIINGFTNYKFLKFNVDSKNLKLKFNYEVPSIRGRLNYKLSGKALFFPLTGSGPVQFEVSNMKAEGEIIGKIAVNSNGDKVLQAEKVNFKKLSIGDMNLHIRGLFDGNVMLSSIVHQFAKRYGPQLFEVTRPEVEQFMGDKIAHDFLNPVLLKLPYLVDYVVEN